jgi:hypothetical protein
MELNRKTWNQQHAVLRRLLMKEKNYRKALPVLLAHHAAVHSSKPGARRSYQDEVLAPLTEAQIRYVPPGGQSVVWKLWHITRVEDLTVNLLLAGKKHSLLTEKRRAALGVPYRDAGNDMPPADVARLSRRVNLKALLTYRRAVGACTRRVLLRLDPARLWEKPGPERLQRIVDERGVRKRAAWLLTYWGGHPCANLLLMPATRHPFVHLNEITRMTPTLMRKVPGKTRARR